MDYSSLLPGPQLIGILFVVIGLVQKYLPPKQINKWYGYRSKQAITSQQTWDEANRYSAAFMIRAGSIVFIVGLIIHTALLLLHADAGIQKTVGYLVLFGGAMGIGVFMSMATERHLAKTFKVKKVQKRK